MTVFLNYVFQEEKNIVIVYNKRCIKQLAKGTKR